MTLKEAIKELDIATDENIFVSLYGKPDSKAVYVVQDVAAKLLKHDVKLIQKNHGGVDYGYKCYHFILT